MVALHIRLHAWITVAILTVPVAVWANLCEEQHIRNRHNQEGELLAAETFAAGQYAGDSSYNGRVIGCNRHRDQLADAVENAIGADHQFAANLSPRLVKGHLQYFGLAPLRYGYQVERQSGTWMVTVPVEFHFPDKFPNRLDVSMELAAELGIANTICATTTMKLGHVDRGHVDIDNHPRDKDACRVNRNEVFAGRPATRHLMEFWRRSIQNFWNRPGFEVRLHIIGVDPISSATLQAYERKNIVWHVRMNHKKDSRATYKAIIGKPHPLYAGMSRDIVVHEFGHVLGLDDEYPESQNPPAFRDCNRLGGANYEMCVMPFNPSRERAKGVYAWIVTRRYVVSDSL